MPPWPLVLISIYCACVVLASLGGGWLPFAVRLTHTRMQLMISFVAGLMLGVGLFHMLPHAYAELGSLDRAVWWMMMGLLTMFFLIRAFHFHQHATLETSELPEPPDGPHSHHFGHHDDEDHAHDHSLLAGHAHHHHGGPPRRQPHKLSWIGVALGLTLHTLIDGIALGASVQADVHHTPEVWLLGLGTFLAILLHKPLDAVSITSLMAAGGWSAGWRHAVNAGFALMCPVGAALFLLGVAKFTDYQHLMVGCALAFAAGVFVCISLGDLLPEVEFHSHDRGKLSVALLLGISLAYGIGFLESEHMHSHGGGHTHEAAEETPGHEHHHGESHDGESHPGHHHHEHPGHRHSHPHDHRH